MSKNKYSIRPACSADLCALNRVIDAAVMSWELPERVKRLALDSYHYTEVDLEDYRIMLAVETDRLVGTIAWDRQPHKRDSGQHGLFVHGLYVLPGEWRRGIGRKLFNTAIQTALSSSLDGILIKAQKEARAFYEALGMYELPVNDSTREYAHRYWLAL